VPYVECPRVEKPPAKNMIARTIRMIRSKTRVRLSAYFLFHCETTVYGPGGSLLNYHALANHIQACATVYPEEARPGARGRVVGS
jgi:hypothetical protein